MLALRKDWFLAVAAFIFGLAISTGGCSGDEGNPCVEFCKTVEQKVVDQIPDAQTGFCSADPEFAMAKTCDACTQVFVTLYSVSITDPQNCGGFF